MMIAVVLLLLRKEHFNEQIQVLLKTSFVDVRGPDLNAANNT